MRRVLGYMVLGLACIPPGTQVALRSRVSLFLAPTTHPQAGSENKMRRYRRREICRVVRNMSFRR